MERKAGGSRNRGWLERPVGGGECWQTPVQVDVGIGQRRERVARNRRGRALCPLGQTALDPAEHNARGRSKGGHPPLPHQAGVSVMHG